MTAGYLLFLLSGRIFGAELRGAVEIMPWRQGRRVPLSYSYVEGLIDYRGVIYPVFNLFQLLSLKPLEPIGFIAEGPAQPAAPQSIILLEESKMLFGITVDNVVKMAKIDELSPVPQQTRGLDPQYIKGIAYDNNQEIIILDFERLLFHAG
jgi:purine-binding chemotaxis protein CheW